MFYDKHEFYYSRLFFFFHCSRDHRHWVHAPNVMSEKIWKNGDNVLTGFVVWRREGVESALKGNENAKVAEGRTPSSHQHTLIISFGFNSTWTWMRSPHNIGFSSATSWMRCWMEEKWLCVSLRRLVRSCEKPHYGQEYINSPTTHMRPLAGYL